MKTLNQKWALVLVFVALALLALMARGAEPAISRADIVKTIEHMRALGKEQQVEIEALRAENNQITAEATTATENLNTASVQLLALQKQIDAVTAWGNQQAAQANYWHTKQEEALKKLWWWRLVGGGGIVLGILLITGGLFLRFTKAGVSVMTTVAAKYAKYAI